MRDTIRLTPELSAQGIRKRPNPMLGPSWNALKDAGLTDRVDPLVVDYGCGKLRNVATLLSFSSHLILVDTKAQLTTPHDFYGRTMLASEFIKEHWPKPTIRLLTSAEFERSKVCADVLFIINVFDVVPERVRRQMLTVAIRHLKRNSLLVLVVPRNDHWTLRLCTPGRAFKDGFAFKHPRGWTYYKNWPGSSLGDWVRARGLAMVRDLSCYRQACLVCKIAR